MWEPRLKTKQVWSHLINKQSIKVEWGVAAPHKTFQTSHHQCSERAISKTMDRPTHHQYKEMLQVIKSSLESKCKGLKMNSIAFLHALWTLQALSDTNLGADKDTRISVYGFIISFCGIPIAWKSQVMRSVVLSSTEAEFIGVSEVVREL